METESDLGGNSNLIVTGLLAGHDRPRRERPAGVIDGAAPGGGAIEVPARLVRLHDVDELPLPGFTLRVAPMDQPHGGQLIAGPSSRIVAPPVD